MASPTSEIRCIWDTVPKILNFFKNKRKFFTYKLLLELEKTRRCPKWTFGAVVLGVDLDSLAIPHVCRETAGYVIGGC